MSNCQPNQLLCSESADCCSGYCDPDFGVCDEPPECVAVGDPCMDRGDASCCSGLCAEGTCVCLPEGLACGFDEDCCSGSCLGQVCEPAGCGEPGQGCGDDFECCSGVCNDGTCTWACAAEVFSCDHGMCEIGAALDPSCAECTGPVCDPDPDCVAKICQDDDYCCCTEWDQICVDEVARVCNKVCLSN